jgi:thiol:disulfide interchange protein DsbC
MRYSLILALAILLAIPAASPAEGVPAVSPAASPAASAPAADEPGAAGMANCRSLTPEEARTILLPNVDNVLSVQPSPVKGLWEIDVEKNGRRWPLYLDCSREHVVAGQIFELNTHRNLTGNRMLSLNRIDVSTIPLEGSVVIGKPDAPKRIIVFDDPDCHYCARLHETEKAIVAQNADVAFYVKPFSRNKNPATYAKALSVVCAGTVQALDNAFAGKPLPDGNCGSHAVQETTRITDRLNIHQTPTMIFPDGRIVPGALDAERILSLLNDAPPPAQAQSGKGEQETPAK